MGNCPAWLRVGARAPVALANKIARIAWAVSVRESDYRVVPAAA
jgi:hypothetical protein